MSIPKAISDVDEAAHKRANSEEAKRALFGQDDSTIRGAAAV